MEVRQSDLSYNFIYKKGKEKYSSVKTLLEEVFPSFLKNDVTNNAKQC